MHLLSQVTYSNWQASPSFVILISYFWLSNASFPSLIRLFALSFGSDIIAFFKKKEKKKNGPQKIYKTRDTLNWHMNTPFSESIRTLWEQFSCTWEKDNKPIRWFLIDQNKKLAKTQSPFFFVQTILFSLFCISKIFQHFKKHVQEAVLETSLWWWTSIGH